MPSGGIYNCDGLPGPGRYICYDCYDEFPEDEMHSLDSKNHICRGCEEKKQARIAAHAERVEKALEEINGNGSLGS